MRIGSVLYWHWILVISYLSFFTAFAQDPQIPLNRYWQISFLKGDNTWDWRGDVIYGVENNIGIGFSLDYRINPNLLIQRYNEQKWKDESKLNAYLYKRFTDDYLGVYVNSWSLVNKQTDIIHRYSNHAVGIRSAYHFNENILIKPHLGYQRSEDKSYIDFGWDAGIDAEVKRMYLGDYRTNLYLDSEFDIYPQRENISNQIGLNIKKQFSSLARDSLRITYTKSKQQYYYSPLHPFVNVDMESKNLDNVLNYTLSSRSYLQLNTIIADRRISDDNPINPNVRRVFRIENRLGYGSFSPKFLFYLGMHTFQETQDNVDLRTDSKAAQFGVRTDFSFLFGDTDRLDFQFDLIKFQYDTPAIEENYDDRDEIRLVGQTHFYHQFSPLLSINLNGYINFCSIRAKK